MFINHLFVIQSNREIAVLIIFPAIPLFKALFKHSFPSDAAGEREKKNV